MRLVDIVATNKTKKSASQELIDMKKILLERQEELESNIKKYQNVLSGKDVTSLQDQVIYDALENAKNEKI